MVISLFNNHFIIKFFSSYQYKEITVEIISAMNMDYYHILVVRNFNELYKAFERLKMIFLFSTIATSAGDID